MIFYMKRNILFFILLLFVTSLSAEPIYKTFLIDGEEISEWVNLFNCTEYDENNNIKHEENPFGEKSFYYGNDGTLKKTHVCFSITNIEIDTVYNYDKSGNQIYSKTTVTNPIIPVPTVEEKWANYKKNHIVFEKKATNGYNGYKIDYEFKAEINSNDQYKHKKRTGDGSFEVWFKYDESGNKIYEKQTGDNAHEYQFKYDDEKRLVYAKKILPNEYEYWRTYNSEDRIIYEKQTGYQACEHYIEYDSQGNIISEKYSGSHNTEYFAEFDEFNRLIHSKQTGDDSFECWKTWNALGKISYEKRTGAKPYEFKYYYDTKGNILCQEDFSEDGKEYFYYEYDYYPNGSIKKSICWQKL